MQWVLEILCMEIMSGHNLPGPAAPGKDGRSLFARAYVGVGGRSLTYLPRQGFDQLGVC